VSNIGKKKDWVPCPAMVEEIGQEVGCLVGYHSTPWDGQSLIREDDLQADGCMPAEIEKDTFYFNFCPDCGRKLRKGG
jgi:hypothetical protein